MTDITSQDIRDLRDEAGTVGDLTQVAICDKALDGNEAAWADCAQVITEFRCEH